MKIYLIRHGETDWNTVKRLQGNTDIPLNEKGIRDAEITAQALDREGIRFDIAFTSHLSRAVRTCEILSAASGCKIVEDRRICEVCFGEAEGKTLDELKADPKYANVVCWFTAPEKFVPEYGVESFEHFFARLRNFIDTEILPLEGKAETVLIASHGGVVRGITNILSGSGIEDFARTKIPNLGINVFNLKNGMFTVEYTGRTLY